MICRNVLKQFWLSRLLSFFQFFHCMKASSLLAVDIGAPERVAADGNPMNLFWFFLKLGSRAIFYSCPNKSNMKNEKSGYLRVLWVVARWGRICPWFCWRCLRYPMDFSRSWRDVLHFEACQFPRKQRRSTRITCPETQFQTYHRRKRLRHLSCIYLNLCWLRALKLSYHSHICWHMSPCIVSTCA